MAKAARVLTYREDIHCVAFHLLLMAAYGVAFWLYHHPELVGVEGPWSRVAFIASAALMLGWCSGINVGVNFHNAVHRKVFRYDWLNRWFERTWTVSGGWPSFFWAHSHTTVHHDNLLHDNDWTLPLRDEYGNFENPYRYSLLHWPWRYAKHLWIDFRSGRGGPGVGRRAVKELAIFAALFSIPFWIDPMMALWLWVIPAWIGNVAVMAPGMVAQHDGREKKTDAVPYGHSTTFLAQFFNLTMFNIGYHIEHHDHPQAHWTALPKLHRRLKSELVHGGAHVVPYGYYRSGHLLLQGSMVPAQRNKFLAQHPDYLPDVVPAPERRRRAATPRSSESAAVADARKTVSTSGSEKDDAARDVPAREESAQAPPLEQAPRNAARHDAKRSRSPRSRRERPSPDSFAG